MSYGIQNVMLNSFNLFYYFLCHIFLKFYQPRSQGLFLNWGREKALASAGLFCNPIGSFKLSIKSFKSIIYHKIQVKRDLNHLNPLLSLFM